MGLLVSVVQEAPAALQRVVTSAAFALIGLVICSNVDNVIRPVIYKRVSGLHPMATIVGAFAGVELFGLVGLLIGPLALAYCVELYRLYESEYGASHEVNIDVRA